MVGNGPDDRPGGSVNNVAIILDEEIATESRVPMVRSLLYAIRLFHDISF